MLYFFASRNCYTIFMRHTLEQSKLFQPIAWLVVILFAGFVFMFIQNSKDSLTQMRENTSTLEANIATDIPVYRKP